MKTVFIRVTEDEKRSISRAATFQFLRPAQFMRQLVLSEAQRVIEKEEKKVA